jgi:membrane-associated protease RseP (regulator of RpoE activity)
MWRLALLAGALVAGTAAAPMPALDRLIEADARLQTIGWRLARGNAPFCAETRPATGLLLMDAANFRDPAAIRAALGLTGDIAVNAVAQGSPAQRAGLKPGEGVVALAGQAMAALPPAAAQDPFRLAGLHDRLDRELAITGTVTLQLADRAVTISAEPACAARFAIGPAGQKPVSGDGRVILGQADAEAGEGHAAAIAAHELAHVILRHTTRGASFATIRAQEQAADRLAPWLLANAGYDPAAMLRLAEGRGDGLIAPATHGSWRHRARAIRAELAAVAAAGPPPLDWRSRFAPPA